MIFRTIAAVIYLASKEGVPLGTLERPRLIDLLLCKVISGLPPGAFSCWTTWVVRGAVLLQSGLSAAVEAV